MSTGQWMHPADGPAWFFDAGAESLDFAYTGDMGRGVPAWERLHSPHDLGAWLAEHVTTAPADEPGERDLADALILRAALTRLYIAAADGQPLAPDDIDTLNLFAATPDVPPALDGGRRQAGAGRIRAAQALSMLAREAVVNLAGRSDGRIRRCDADDCRMVYRDESRTDSRRWCSMQRCGNRAKVRAHRARSARGGGHF
ncbi:CGNR zinc finger domain-containing protein [Protaetiibacter mangrovi]|uniref:CGNR zinc finger domain-containing protein n=1 Tax=Protaetiibacter mangrovi TaxID=2970926 RepID=A0ABT1ZD37_9MICO|nr:CGNR zinc finger domain-containing protein [Protaetiibacter mangrovi]MCS0498612.1 CGNR zinc finger domain-containing protein [Protaetiibacter mangrovi]